MNSTIGGSIVESSNPSKLSKKQFKLLKRSCEIGMRRFYDSRAFIESVTTLDNLVTSVRSDTHTEYLYSHASDDRYDRAVKLVRNYNKCKDMYKESYLLDKVDISDSLSHYDGYAVTATIFSPLIGETLTMMMHNSSKGIADCIQGALLLMNYTKIALMEDLLTRESMSNYDILDMKVADDSNKIYNDIGMYPAVRSLRIAKDNCSESELLCAIKAIKYSMYGIYSYLSIRDDSNYSDVVASIDKAHASLRNMITNYYRVASKS